MFVTNAKNAQSSPLACTPRPLAPPGREHADNASRADNLVLVRQAQRGNPAAFEELVRRCHKALLRLALRLTGSEHDAQDVCQETFLSAYQNLARFRLECQFHTWIYRIATNRCLDYWRRRKSPRENSSLTVSLDSEESAVLNRMADHRPAHNPESNLAARDLGTSIARALEKLSPRERTVFEMKHCQGLKLRAVAAILNTSESNARHTLFRATRKLRSALADVR